MMKAVSTPPLNLLQVSLGILRHMHPILRAQMIGPVDLYSDKLRNTLAGKFLHSLGDAAILWQILAHMIRQMPVVSGKCRQSTENASIKHESWSLLDRRMLLVRAE